MRTFLPLDCLICFLTTGTVLAQVRINLSESNNAKSEQTYSDLTLVSLSKNATIDTLI